MLTTKITEFMQHINEPIINIKHSIKNEFVVTNLQLKGQCLHTHVANVVFCPRMAQTHIPPNTCIRGLNTPPLGVLGVDTVRQCYTQMNAFTSNTFCMQRCEDAEVNVCPHTCTHPQHSQMHTVVTTVFPIKSFHFSIFHKCSHISKTKRATDKRHTFLESASLSASTCVVIKSSRDCHMEINIINYY